MEISVNKVKSRILAVSFIFCLSFSFFPVYVFGEEKSVEREVVTLENCIDKDTASFKNADQTVFKVRFLASDSSELEELSLTEEEEFFAEVNHYICDLLTNAKKIELEYESSSVSEDAYGRKFAWVFVDDVFLQEKLVELGYIQVASLDETYKYTESLQEKEKEASEKGLGIWQKETILDREQEELQENPEEENLVEEKKKSWFQKLIDHTLGQILKSIDKLLERIVKMIENML